MKRLRVITRYGEFASGPQPWTEDGCREVFSDISEIHGLSFCDEDGKLIFIPRSIILESILIIADDGNDQ